MTTTTLNIKTTSFETEIDNITKRREGNYLHGKYDFYSNFTIYNKIILNDKIELYANYQTGNNYLYNDYNCPNPALELADDAGTSEVLILINKLYASDFEKDDIYETLEEVKNICSEIDTIEKLEQVYDALNDNLPVLDDFLDNDILSMPYTE